MKGSIRKFLLINLLLTMVLTTILTALGNYYLDKKDIESHLDLLLGQASFNFQALLGEDFHARDLQQLQDGLNKIPLESSMFYHKIGKMALYRLNERYQFQVWSDSGELLLKSARAPATPLSTGQEGINNVKVNGTIWRTFTTHNHKLGIYLVVAEKYGMLTHLTNSLAKDDIYIMLLIYPLAGLLIWLIVGRGLASISRVTDEVSHRVPNFLEPVKATNVPSEIKPLVVELNKLFLRLNQALEREKRFAGDAAHELRTPLAALRTQTQVALNSHNETERNKLLRNVVIAVDRCTHVVQQLLTLSRLVPESDSLADASSLDLNKVSAEIIAQLAPLALQKHIDIELIHNEKKSAYIKGNATAISILIRNLVDNAIRYTPEFGKISVKIERLRALRKVKLIVSDNGPGIPPELESRVFERFYRVLGNKSPGSGLGLAIVQQIAKLHEADIKLGTPKSGRGLQVTVTFNLA